MNNTQLETFLKIVDTSSFTAAANLLGYAQSTVTTQIKQLEDELGCLLFERLGKSLTLTSAGEKLTEYAEKMLQLEREIMLEIPMSKEPSGLIKLGVSESLCYNRLPQVMLSYKRKYPKMNIRLQFVNHDTFPALLKKGALDIVYTLNPLMDNSELKLLGKRKEQLGFFTSRSHPLAGKKRVKEADLTGVPLLITSHNCNFRRMLLEDFAKLGITPTIELETSSKEILKQFAMNGMGVAFMPEMAAREELKDNRLVKLNWAGNPFPVYSQLFVHKDKHISPAMDELIKLI